MWSSKVEGTSESALRRYFTADAPLGPLNVGVVDKEHAAIVELLTERDLVNLQGKAERPSIIVGRRGSGKTSYLRKLGLVTPESMFLDIRTDRTFNLILGSINNIIRDAVTVESITTVWDAIFWNCLFWLAHRAGKPKIGHQQIFHHLQSVGIDTCNSRDAVMSSLSRLMEKIAKESSGFALDRTADVLRGKEYENLKALVVSDLQRDKVTAIIVLDSLDEYPVRVGDFKKALAGLLKCAGEFNAAIRNYDLRLCLPSELYWEFVERISTNPQKDFSNQLIVRWQVGELLIAVCRRLLIYLRLWHPRAYGLVRDNKLITRRDADAFFALIFPSHVKNLNGKYERTDQYLLRHTQLLPRQMLLILSEILRFNAVDDNFIPGKSSFISEDSIRLGIRDTEDRIVQEIFSAYRDRHGDGIKETCMAIIPSLPKVFTADQFAKAVRKFGEEHGRQIPAAPIKAMLLEVGAFGKLDKPDSIYNRGRFEYTMTSRLAVGTDDRLCVHPLFSRVFECQIHDPNEPPILPWSADL